MRRLASDHGQIEPDRSHERRMHPILATDQLSPNVTRLVVEAPGSPQIRQAGPVRHRPRCGPGAERIPLTIADADPAAGTITLVIQAVGKSTPTSSRSGRARRSRRRRPAGPPDRAHRLAATRSASAAASGPRSSFRIAQELPRRGVAVTSVIGGRSREWVILEEELRRDRRGHRLHRRRQLRPAGLRDRGARRTCSRPAAIDAVYAVGPVPMMRAVAELTRPFGVPTTVSLNAIMVDGTGMCGGCRVSVGGETRTPAWTAPSSTATRSTSRCCRPADHLSRVRAAGARTARRRWIRHRRASAHGGRRDERQATPRRTGEPTRARSRTG